MNWSLSKLGTFTKCRRKFLYSYIQRLPRPRGAAAERGVDQHAHVEAYFKDGTPLPLDLRSYTEWFEMLRGLNYTAEAKLAMLAGWVPCAWEDPAAWWKGVLDLLVLRGRTAWVFDWKTGKVYPDHDDQKELYSIAVFQAYPEIEEIEAWHVYIDLVKHSKVTYTRKDVGAVDTKGKSLLHLAQLITKWEKKLIPYFQALDQLNKDSDGEYYTVGSTESFFVTNPTYLCDYCPYSRNPCPH